MENVSWSMIKRFSLGLENGPSSLPAPYRRKLVGANIIRQVSIKLQWNKNTLQFSIDHGYIEGIYGHISIDYNSHGTVQVSAVSNWIDLAIKASLTSPFDLHFATQALLGSKGIVEDFQPWADKSSLHIIGEAN